MGTIKAFYTYIRTINPLNYRKRQINIFYKVKQMGSVVTFEQRKLPTLLFTKRLINSHIFLYKSKKKDIKM